MRNSSEHSMLQFSLQLSNMIKLTKLNGHDCLLNHALIEIIEESPDTCITLNNGNRYLVLESADEIRERVIAFQVEVLQRAGIMPNIKPTTD